MTDEFRAKLIVAGADELALNSCMVEDEGGQQWVAGLLTGYQLGSPGAFAGMAQIPFDEDGGVRTLVREALELERMATTR